MATYMRCCPDAVNDAGVQDDDGRTPAASLTARARQHADQGFRPAEQHGLLVVSVHHLNQCTMCCSTFTGIAPVCIRYSIHGGALATCSTASDPIAPAIPS